MSNWHKGYKEVKNVIHNEIGLTKDEILKVLQQVAKDEISSIVSDNKHDLFEMIRDIIREEIVSATQKNDYPKVHNHIWDFGTGKDENSFKNYISGVMKQEITKQLREQFQVKIDIQHQNDSNRD